jgi:hypothetical protein
MPLLSGVPDPKVGAASRIISRMGGDSFHLAVAENGVARGVASLTVARSMRELKAMSREQKLQAMHEIWEDLTAEALPRNGGT